MTVRPHLALLALALGTTVAASAADWAAPSEPLEVRTLAGDTRAFPRDAPVPRTIFVVTYSKAATTAASDWTRRLREIKPQWEVKVYQVWVLDDLPTLFRGPVITGIAAGVPEELHDRFWVAELHGRQWRLFTDSEVDDVPHIVVLDERRRVAWRANGPATDDKVLELVALPPPSTQAR
jgi:hypothetical protein